MKKIIFLSVFVLFTFVACSNNLQWSEKSPYNMNWKDAMNYCKNLNEGGHNDWRLPTISELRSLIQNCPATQTGGKCKVTDNCLSWSDCRNDLCSGCNDSSGKYSKLDDTTPLLSSSVPSDISGGTWLVMFSKGGVFSLDKSFYYYVRCVR